MYFNFEREIYTNLFPGLRSSLFILANEGKCQPTKGLGESHLFFSWLLIVNHVSTCFMACDPHALA